MSSRLYFIPKFLPFIHQSLNLCNKYCALFTDDSNPIQKEIKEINSGIYCFDIEELLHALDLIEPNNAQGEYYLTDVIKIMNEKGLKTGAVIVEDNTEILGVNDRAQLELLTRVLRMRINAEHMRNGVTIEDSNSTYIYVTQSLLQK